MPLLTQHDASSFVHLWLLNTRSRTSTFPSYVTLPSCVYLRVQVPKPYAKPPQSAPFMITRAAQLVSRGPVGNSGIDNAQHEAGSRRQRRPEGDTDDRDPAMARQAAECSDRQGPGFEGPWMPVPVHLDVAAAGIRGAPESQPIVYDRPAAACAPVACECLIN